MCTRHRVQSEILARLESQLRRVRPPRPFRRLAIAVDCRQVPGDVDSLVAHLAAEFTEEQLELSGLFLPGDEGRWRWRTDWGPPGSPLIVLREGPEAPPFEMLAPTGGLVGDEIPVVATLLDYRTAKWLAKTGGRLLVGNSTPAVACFRSLLLPAATSASLIDLSGPQWQQLAERLGWSGPNGQEDMGNAAATVSLTLVNCAPETLSAEENPHIRRLAERLARVQRCLHRDMPQVAVCSPTAAEVEDIAFCLEQGDLNAATEALLASADNSSFAVSAYADPNFQPWHEPSTLLEARVELARLAVQSDDSVFGKRRRQRVESLYQAFVETELIAPLLQRAQAAGNPIDANLYLLAADAFRMLHGQNPWLHQQLHQALQTSPGPEGAKVSSDLLKPHQQHTSSAIKLIKELNR